MAAQPPTLDPASTQPVSTLADGQECRLFHLKPGCKRKGEWVHYRVDHSRNGPRGNIALVQLPITPGITFTRQLAPDTPVEVVTPPDS